MAWAVIRPGIISGANFRDEPCEEEIWSLGHPDSGTANWILFSVSSVSLWWICLPQRHREQNPVPKVWTRIAGPTSMM
jgi:hypothetical protein